MNKLVRRVEQKKEGETKNYFRERARERERERKQEKNKNSIETTYLREEIKKKREPNKIKIPI